MTGPQFALTTIQFYAERSGDKATKVCYPAFLVFSLSFLLQVVVVEVIHVFHCIAFLGTHSNLCSVLPSQWFGVCVGSCAVGSTFLMIDCTFLPAMGPWNGVI